MLRAVLLERQSVEQSAKLRGAETSREIWFWSRLFRACLTVLAVAFGFATSTARPYRPAFIDGHDPALDPGRQTDARDLADLRLRSGRVNGRNAGRDSA